jgi:hypothetical protein
MAAAHGQCKNAIIDARAVLEHKLQAVRIPAF